MSAKHKIVLAWVVEDFEVVGERRTDLGERPKLRQVDVAKTVMWLNRGSDEDVKKAKAYAAKELNYEIVVLTYPTAEKDPLGRAKKDVLKMAAKLRKAAR